MDFNLATAAIGLGLLLLCLTPIIWLHWSATRGDKKLKAIFNQVAENQNIHLSAAEIWSTRYGIGLDQSSGKLMYGRWLNGTFETITINLKNMSRCMVAKEMDGNHVDRVYLQILMNNEPQQKLEFYNSDISPSLTEEFLIAQKWQQTIAGNK